MKGYEPSTEESAQSREKWSLLVRKTSALAQIHLSVRTSSSLKNPKFFRTKTADVHIWRTHFPPEQTPNCGRLLCTAHYVLSNSICQTQLLLSSPSIQLSLSIQTQVHNTKEIFKTVLLVHCSHYLTFKIIFNWSLFFYHMNIILCVCHATPTQKLFCLQSFVRLEHHEG